MSWTGAAGQRNTLIERAAAVWRCLAARRRGVLAAVMIAPSLAVPAVVLATPPSAPATGAIDAVSAGTANGAESPSGPVGGSAATSATETPSGVPFQVTYDGKWFATYNGTAWSSASIDPYSEQAGGTKAIPGDILRAVSCGSPTQCEAPDSDGYTFSYGNGTWTAGTQLPGTGWADISCGSATNCTAVGGDSYAVLTGQTWSAPKTIDSATVNAVSCTSAAFCEAVDANGDALTYNGSAWTAPSPALPGIPLTTVSCAAPGTCKAAGVDRATMESEAISGHPT